MGAKGTGESPISFEYFEEFDNLFGCKPNIKPVAVASSLLTEHNVSEEPVKKRVV